MRLAALGSPIAHSKSPALHRAAYAVLGLDWSYDAIEVSASGLTAFIETRGDDWRGLSLTMPLKRDVIPLLARMDRFTELTSVANTLLFDENGLRHGFNTDVTGIVEAFRRFGVTALTSVRILGGGATAASAVTAVARLGAQHVTVSVRTPERLGAIVALAELLDVELRVETLGAFDSSDPVEAVVSTLPTGTVLEHDLPHPGSGILLDVAYEPWPSALAATWTAAGGTAISGLEMLAAQAVGQVRIFVGGSPDIPLANEAAVVDAMRAAVGLPA